MDDAALIRMEQLWEQGLRTHAIADEIFYNAEYVRYVAAKNRDRFPYRRHVVSPDVREDMTRRLVNGEVTKHEVMESLGVCRETVNSWLRNKDGS